MFQGTRERSDSGSGWCLPLVLGPGGGGGSPDNLYGELVFAAPPTVSA